jgi:hypothetical protein
MLLLESADLTTVHESTPRKCTQCVDDDLEAISRATPGYCCF